MAADCYWCEEGKSDIPITLGTKGNPIGCCENCYVMACGHHAQRDPKKQVFHCLDCDPKMLTASAQALVDAESDAPTVEAVRIGKVRLIYDGDEDDYFTSFNDFRIRRPGYGNWLAEIERLHGNIAGGGIGDKFDRWPLDAQLLLLAAAYILAKTAPDAPLDDWGYPDIVVQLKKKVNENNDRGRDSYRSF